MLFEHFFVIRYAYYLLVSNCNDRLMNNPQLHLPVTCEFLKSHITAISRLISRRVHTSRVPFSNLGNSRLEQGSAAAAAAKSTFGQSVQARNFRAGLYLLQASQAKARPRRRGGPSPLEIRVAATRPTLKANTRAEITPTTTFLRPSLSLSCRQSGCAAVDYKEEAQAEPVRRPAGARSLIYFAI